jgi:hypothetical protein
MQLFTDRFMATFVRNAQRAAAEPDELTRELQMAPLAASVLSRLTGSDTFDKGERQPHGDARGAFHHAPRT